MKTYDLLKEAEFSPDRHVEKILGDIADGDVTVACWEPGQISPNHCHPDAVEMYYCVWRYSWCCVVGVAWCVSAS